MRHFSDTKHKKVLRKSKKQWITVGLTSAALGITGLVHNAELVNAEETLVAGSEDETEVTDPELDNVEQDDNQLAVQELINTYKTNAQGEVDYALLLSEFSNEVSALEGVVVEDAINQFKTALNESSNLTEEPTEEVEEPVETVEEPVVEEEPIVEEPVVEEEPVVVEEPAADAVAFRSAAAQPASFTASNTDATEANLDVFLGEDTHRDGTPMEVRQVDIELNQAEVRDAIMAELREFRREMYNRNIAFVYPGYDRPTGANSNTNTLVAAAREAGYNTVDEYVNAIQWSDRLEDYSIQRATELLTTGFHSGNQSHFRPDGHTGSQPYSSGRRAQHHYRNADETIDHSAPESIHANGNDDIHRALWAWGEREVANLIKAGGEMTYGGQSVTTAHIHQILSPVHTRFGGASVVLADGQSGAQATRANVLIATKWDAAANNHVSGSEAREGTYRVNVQTKQGSAELPGEVDQTQDVEVSIEFDTEYVFNIELDEGAEVTTQEGINGLEVNGVVVREPVTEIIELGPIIEVIPHDPAIETFDPSLDVGQVVTVVEGEDGAEYTSPISGVVERVDFATTPEIAYGPERRVEEFDTIREVNFDLGLGEENVVTAGQNGEYLYNPLTDELHETVTELVTERIEFGVELREEQFETERVAVIDLEEEETVQEGVNGRAYFDAEGNRYTREGETEEPVNEIIHYPAIIQVVDFETERVAVVEQFEGERVITEGEDGLAYYDEEGNLLEVIDEVTNREVHYSAEIREVGYDTVRRPVIGLDEERIVTPGVEGIEYVDEDGNVLEDSTIEPTDEVIEYPAIEEILPYEQYRRVADDLAEGEERLVQEGAEGIAYYDEDGELLEMQEPVNEIIEYGEAEEDPVTDDDEDENDSVTDDDNSSETPTDPTNNDLQDNRDLSTKVISGLTNLTEEERAQIIAAINATEDTSKIDELVQAAKNLHDSRAESESVDHEDQADGETLPDTATSTWALGLLGLTSVLSGLGVKKFKD